MALGRFRPHAGPARPNWGQPQPIVALGFDQSLGRFSLESWRGPRLTRRGDAISQANRLTSSDSLPFRLGSLRIRTCHVSSAVFWLSSPGVRAISAGLACFWFRSANSGLDPRLGSTQFGVCSARPRRVSTASRWHSAESRSGCALGAVRPHSSTLMHCVRPLLAQFDQAWIELDHAFLVFGCMLYTCLFGMVLFVARFVRQGHVAGEASPQPEQRSHISPKSGVLSREPCAPMFGWMFERRPWGGVGHKRTLCPLCVDGLALGGEASHESSYGPDFLAEAGCAFPMGVSSEIGRLRPSIGHFFRERSNSSHYWAPSPSIGRACARITGIGRVPVNVSPKTKLLIGRTLSCLVPADTMFGEQSSRPQGVAPKVQAGNPAPASGSRAVSG